MCFTAIESYKIQPYSQIVYVGAQVRIWCEETKEVSWLKDGKVIHQSSRIIENARPGELLISLAVVEDTGSYSCQEYYQTTANHQHISKLIVGGM